MTRKTAVLAALPTLVLALWTTAVPAWAQESRAAVIERARGEFDQEAALDLLMRAADPTAGGADSLWAVGVYEIAKTLQDMGRDAEVEVWLRWIRRQPVEWAMDPGWFPPSLIETYEGQAGVMGSDPEVMEAAAATSWEWPAEYEMEASGRLRVEAGGSPSGLTVSVEGRGAVTPGEALELEPGTYRLEATAAGRAPVRVSREVLPGVTTVVALDLPAELGAEARSRVAAGLVSIRANLGGGEVCTNGVVREDGLVLTSLSGLPRTSELDVVTGGGVRHRDLSVVGRDEARDLAVLRLGSSEGSVLEAGEAEAGDYAWTLYRPGCGSPTTGLARLGAWPSGASGRVALGTALDGGAAGGPLVDPGGDLLAIVVSATEVVPVSAAEDLLRRALSVVAEGEQVPVAGDGGGGFPALWVGAGVAVVGVAAAVLAGGGGGDGNGNGTGNGDRSGIRITLPGGAP